MDDQNVEFYAVWQTTPAEYVVILAQTEIEDLSLWECYMNE